jgi:hypothetical protein
MEHDMTNHEQPSLWLALALGLGVAACASPDPNESTEVGHTQQPIRGGPVIPGAEGIVDFFKTAGVGTLDPSANCTGSMIAPKVVLTAAHCFDSLGAKNMSSGPANVTIRYYDPDSGLRVVYSGSATWGVVPGYDGALTPSGPGGSNDDMAVLVIPESFAATTYKDYLRIYADVDGPLYGLLSLFGAGLFSYSGNDDNKLRTGDFEVESVDINHIVVDTQDLLSPCLGDSGGPAINWGPLKLIAGVLSKMETDSDTEGTNCANNDWPNDNAFFARVNSTRVSWIQQTAGLTCPITDSTSTTTYRRCFALPFIEDIASEGGRLGVQVAIASALL